MKLVTHLFIFGLIGFFLFGAFYITNAQSVFDPVGSGVIASQISSTVSPENPTAGQTVSISLTSSDTNLNNSSISWSVNGARVQSGTGVTQFTVTAGKNGEVKKVIATITPASGPTITKTFNVTPQDISIVYESDGYIPPFYKGKAIFGKEGSVTLVAMPNLISSGGIRLNPANLTYKWSVDGTVQGSKSGYGKSTFVYTGSLLSKEVLIEVEINSSDGATKGKGLMLLGPQDSEVLVYERNPLYGILFNKELSSNSFSLKDKEVTVQAIPFSSSATGQKDPLLSYLWTINGSTIPVPAGQNYATFRNSTGQEGDSLIGVSVTNSSHLLQLMKKTFSISF